MSVSLQTGDRIEDVLDYLHPRGVVVGVNEQYATVNWGNCVSVINRYRLPIGWRVN